MLSIGFLFETVVEKVFELFEKTNIKEVYLKEDFDKLIDLIINICKKNKIYIEFVENLNIEKIRGSIKHIENDNNYNSLIQIEIPEKKELINEDYKDLFRTFLHELSHSLSINNIPEFLPIKKRGKLFGKLSTYILLPNEYQLVNFTKEDLIKYLDYIFNPREKSTYAFEVAISCYFDHISKINIQKIYDQNKTIITKYFKNEINFINLEKYFHEFKGDSYKLFLIQFAVEFLRQDLFRRKKIIKSKEERNLLISEENQIQTYYNQLISFVKLCNYYEIRIEKLLGEK